MSVIDHDAFRDASLEAIWPELECLSVSFRSGPRQVVLSLLDTLDQKNQSRSLSREIVRKAH